MSSMIDASSGSGIDDVGCLCSDRFNASLDCATMAASAATFLMLPTAAAGGTGTASTAIESGGDIDDDPIRLLRKTLIRWTIVLPAFDLVAARQV